MRALASSRSQWILAVSGSSDGRRHGHSEAEGRHRRVGAGPEALTALPPPFLAAVGRTMCCRPLQGPFRPLLMVPWLPDSRPKRRLRGPLPREKPAVLLVTANTRARVCRPADVTSRGPVRQSGTQERSGHCNRPMALFARFRNCLKTCRGLVSRRVVSWYGPTWLRLGRVRKINYLSFSSRISDVCVVASYIPPLLRDFRFTS